MISIDNCEHIIVSSDISKTYCFAFAYICLHPYIFFDNHAIILWAYEVMYDKVPTLSPLDFISVFKDAIIKAGYFNTIWDSVFL